MILFVLFILYIVFDIPTPEIIASYVDTPVGMVVVLLLCLYSFLFFHPLIGIVALFVGYELVRRSGKANNRVPMILYTPTQAKKDAEIAAMQPPNEKTLEEEMVEQMAPIGKSSMITYTVSDYKPVAGDTHGATLI
jgi:hypothetical protein